MRRPVLLGFLVAAGGAAASCTQIAGVQEVTFTAEAGADGGTREGGAVDAPTKDAPSNSEGGKADASDADSGTTPLPGEDCPLCSGSMCCSPNHCTAGKCCADRSGPCTKAADCCNMQCDVDAGRCTGACLNTGDSTCVVDGDCCEGTCDSAGKCVAACAKVGVSCRSDHDCCFGLGCTSSDAGVCFMP